MSSLESRRMKSIRGIRRVFSSIFTKLLLILVVAGICITLVISYFFRSGTSQYREAVQENVAQYLNYLVQDLGVPPDLEKAEKIAQQYSLKIRYESPNITWSTSESLPPVDQIQLSRWREFPELHFAHYEGIHLIALQQGEGIFLFTMDLGQNHDKIRNKWILGSLIFLVLILLGAYCAIRWILHPIRWLREGVRQVGEGNLRHRVPEKGSAEMRGLSSTFNTMARRIDHMLRSKEQLLLDVSHEFRSPLTRIKVALEFFPDSTVKNDVRDDVDELEKMVSEILETARLDSEYGHLNRKHVKMDQLLQQTLQGFNHQSAHFHLHPMPPVPSLSLDVERISIVLRNILNNALKYSSSSSKPVEVSLQQVDSRVVLHIKNFGAVIPQEELPHIFEPFYRVDKSRSKATGGYGLGLHLCQKIMEAHGGRIEVSSSLADGTTFSLFFQHPEK